MSDSGHDKVHWPLMAFICESNGGIRRIPLCWDNGFWHRLAAMCRETLSAFHFSHNFGADFQEG